jgi:hypothetical protein
MAAVAVRPSSATERTSDVLAPRAARSPSGMMPAQAPDLDESTLSPPGLGIGTMRNLGSLPPSARMRGGTVVSRELPSLEPPLDEPTELYNPGAANLLTTPVRARRPSSASVTIGAAIAARRRPRVPWLLILGLLAAASIGAAVFVYATRGGEKAPDLVEEPPKVPARTTSTVKFVTVPPDAEIAVEGHSVHVGSPWAIDLPAGVHQITIQRSGYKAWLTSLELSANEPQTLRVVLEPLGGAAAALEARLILSTTPEGLEVVLDGKLLPERTPLRMPIRPGRHVIVVRQDGDDVWRHEIDARASVDYEFTPSMTADKQRERAARASSQRRTTEARPAIADADRDERSPGEAGSATGDAAERTTERTTERTVERTAERTIESPALPSISAITPPAGPPAPPPPAAAPAPKGPVIVAPTMVTRVGGDTPTVNKSHRAEVPPVVAAKVCIDTAGHVTSVAVLTKQLERMTVSDLTNALKGWTYKPYLQGGVAVPACFVVSFRVR